MSLFEIQRLIDSHDIRILYYMKTLNIAGEPYYGSYGNATGQTKEASWGNSSFEHCKLIFSLQQLRKRERAGLPPRYRTGGLGLKMQPDVFETWVCVDQHECSNSSIAPMDGWFCWVIDYRIGLPRERAPEQFVPWGHNGYLKLFRSGT